MRPTNGINEISWRVSNKGVFVGLTDIASLIKEYSFGFESLGIKVTSAIFKKTHVAQSSNPTHDLSKLPRWIYRGVRPRKLQSWLQDHGNFPKNALFNKILSQTDLFVFIDRSFYFDYSDFAEIRKRGKKIISVLTGDDCRWYGAMKQEFEKHGMQVIDYPEGYDFSARSMESRLKYLRMCERYSDIIFSLPNQAQMALRPYHAWRLPINLKDFKENTTQRIVPKIVHAPTSRAFKGTKYIVEAVDRLRTENVGFEFELIEGLTNDEAVSRYLQSDIIVSQVMCPSGGRLALEGLAMGKVVMSKMGFENGYDEKFPQPCPIIDVSPQTIYSKMKEVISDYDLRCKIAAQGRQYIAHYFNTELVVAEMIKLIENSRAPDFYPSFFKDSFVPESREFAQVYNGWNNFVSHCDWYKECVGSFERDGLKF